MKQNQKIREFLKKNMPGFDNPRRRIEEQPSKVGVPVDISEKILTQPIQENESNPTVQTQRDLLDIRVPIPEVARNQFFSN